MSVKSRVRTAVPDADAGVFVPAATEGGRGTTERRFLTASASLADASVRQRNSTPDLTNLPPALVVTCEFHPLRDEGAEYAGALAAAGNEVRHLSRRGQVHTSLTMVDVVISGAGAREEMAAALREFFGVTVPA